MAKKGKKEKKDSFISVRVSSLDKKIMKRSRSGPTKTFRIGLEAQESNLKSSRLIKFRK